MNKHCSFLLMALLLFRSLWSISADEQLVTNICKRTGILETCKSALLSDPRSIGATTIDALAIIAFDIAINAGTAASVQANDLARQYRGAPQNNPLGQCAEIYADLTSELQTGKSFAESLSYGKANQAAVDASTKPDACETEFVSRDLAPLLQPTDQDLTNKCRVCASITQLMIG
jgi:pectinesterase inhibitor-like protein